MSGVTSISTLVSITMDSADAARSSCDHGSCRQTNSFDLSPSLSWRVISAFRRCGFSGPARSKWPRVLVPAFRHRPWLHCSRCLNRQPSRGGPTDSNRGHAAVDGEVDACDEACLVGGEEKGSGRDLLRAAEPLERDPRGIRGLGLRDHVRGWRDLLKDVRVVWARANS